jgi:O-antigen/teichoic acid export membrane protein
MSRVKSFYDNMIYAGRSRLVKQRRFIIGFVAQALQYGASLMLLPFLGSRLSSSEISVWYLLITIQGLAVIADFGFGGSFARGIATAMAGADRLQEKGFVERRCDAPNSQLIADLINAARSWYALLGLAVFVIMTTIGLTYVLNVTAGSHLDTTDVVMTWCVMAFATAQSMYFSWVNPILVGANRIEQDLISLIIGKGGSALLGIGALLAGGGMLSLAISQLIALACGRLAAAIFLRPITRSLPKVPHDRTRTWALLRIIAPNATRSGVASLSGFLITRSSVFAATSFVGLAAGGGYAITLQLLSAVMQVSQLPVQFTMPRLVALQAKGDGLTLRREAIQLCGIFILLFLFGAAFLATIVPAIFAHIGRSITLLPTPLLLFLSIVMLLEGLHGVSAFILTTGNKIPFSRAAVLSAVAVAIGTIFAGWQGWGIGGIIAVQGLVQLSYNNWRWPLMLLQDTRLAKA